MAILDIKNAVLTGNVFVPYGVYKLHVKKTKFGPSNAKNPMLTVTAEIIHPETIEHEGQTIGLAGKEVTYYFVFVESQAGRLKEIFTRLNLLETLGKIDTDLPECAEILTKAFDKLCFNAILYSEENVKRSRQTPEQRAKGEQGTPILDESGREIVLGWNIVAQMNDIVGNPEYVQF